MKAAAAIYARYSTENQSANSIEDQYHRRPKGPRVPIEPPLGFPPARRGAARSIAPLRFLQGERDFATRGAAAAE